LFHGGLKKKSPVTLTLKNDVKSANNGLAPVYSAICIRQSVNRLWVPNKTIPVSLSNNQGEWNLLKQFSQ